MFWKKAAVAHTQPSINIYNNFKNIFLISFKV